MASDIQPARAGDIQERLNRALPEPHTFRTRAQIARFFSGLHPVEPGLVRIADWRPGTAAGARHPVPQWGAVARIP